MDRFILCVASFSVRWDGAPLPPLWKVMVVASLLLELVMLAGSKKGCQECGCSLEHVAWSSWLL